MPASQERKKRVVALSSLFAAIGLTTFKIVVGAATGSLGILAEAAHSGLDLVAAAATYLAVRISAKPADREHRYGHGKIENLSALFETLLLLATCAWIVHAAIKRLMSGGMDIEVTVWSFVVMLTSIAVDWSRSRALYRAARECNSQALEADALHFQTDIWSSCVVIVGLISVNVAPWADAVAALFVAVIAAIVTVRLGLRTIYGLLDTAPAGLEERIVRAAESVPGVLDCHNVRMRYSGPNLFVDAHLSVEGSQTLESAHHITEDVEHAIREVVPGADVTLHPEPPER